MWSAWGACHGPRNRQGQSHLLLPGGNRRAAQTETGRGAFSSSWIGPSKPSRRRACTVIGTAVPARTLMLEGTIRSSKSGRGEPIRRRYAYSGTALVLRVVEVQIIRSRRRQHGLEPTVGMMGFQAECLVLMVVVKGQLPPRRVGQLEDRIQGRIEPAGVDLGHHLLPSLALETEHVAVTGLIDAAVDDDRQREPLGLLGRVVGLLFEALWQRVPRERQAIQRPDRRSCQAARCRPTGG